MTGAETAIVFECADQSLLGILHPASSAPRLGVLIVVGGPQYRAGSHRQFVLIARALAAAGYPTLRFDYRGMGDSDGEYLGFEEIGVDMAAAIDSLCLNSPGIERVVLWGLCDAASAILFYAHTDPRVYGIILLNPWVRTAAGEAKTYLRHWYAARLKDGAFWRKLGAGKFDVGESVLSLLSFIRKALQSDSEIASLWRPRKNCLRERDKASLSNRMAGGLRSFPGPVLVITSGNDFTAREFESVTAASSLWRRLLASPRVARRDLPDADHTFARRAWHDQVTLWTLEWLAAQAFASLPIGLETFDPPKSRAGSGRHAFPRSLPVHRA